MVRYSLLSVLFFGFVLDAMALEVPYLSGRVNDRAELVSPAARARIENVLQVLEQNTGAQVAVLTISSLETDALEEFSMRVVETWKLGKKGADNGVLLLVAREERKIRIEVGYGLEPVLTDLSSRRIIDYLMVPTFRAGDFEGGIESAVEAIAGAIEGNPEAIPAAAQEGGINIGSLIFLGFFALLISPFVYYALALPGGGGWFMYAFLIPFFGLFPMVAGKTVALISVGLWLIIGAVLRVIWPKKWQVKPDDGKGSGSGGRSGGSRRSSGFSSGGGFSGGGGSFGGGGASGGW